MLIVLWSLDETPPVETPPLLEHQQFIKVSGQHTEAGIANEITGHLKWLAGLTLRHWVAHHNALVTIKMHDSIDNMTSSATLVGQWDSVP